jgi:hypothetical protein
MMKISETDLAATVIRTEIERWKEAEEQEAEARALRDNETDPQGRSAQCDPDSVPLTTGSDFERVDFGSRLPSLSIEELEILRRDDQIFQNFRSKLGSVLTRLLGRANNNRVTLPSSHTVMSTGPLINLIYIITNHSQITPFQFIKVHYASVIDWRWKSNIIRANPLFHNQPRFDYALVQVDGNRCIFIQLLYIFRVQYLEDTFHLALALPLDAPPLAENRARDKLLRLTRVRPRRKIETIIIDTNIIIRGGLVAEDLSSKVGEFLVVDAIDEDMWRRLKGIEFVVRARV